MMKVTHEQNIEQLARTRRGLMEEVRRRAANGDSHCGQLVYLESLDTTGFLSTMLDYDPNDTDLEGPF